ncbi:MAG: Phage tail protein [Blastocatellia bacterium]|jgi:phage tail-like protein|nr:Phage tail protein [Blastocatellia bacterium]
MSSPNLEYLYGNLPARMRRDDEELFLKRFLSFFGETLDKFDGDLDTFHERVAPETASEGFLEWWLYAFFGWAWFPTWFTLARKRAFYASITKHYARRGTALGIKEFLEAFGLRVIVETEPLFFGEACSEPIWSIVGPLGIVVRLFPETDAVLEELEFFGEATASEATAMSPGQNLQRVDVDELLRFVAPVAQIIMIEEIQFSQL